MPTIRQSEVNLRASQPKNRIACISRVDLPGVFSEPAAPEAPRTAFVFSGSRPNRHVSKTSDPVGDGETQYWQRKQGDAVEILA